MPRRRGNHRHHKLLSQAVTDGVPVHRAHHLGSNRRADQIADHLGAHLGTDHLGAHPATDHLGANHIRAHVPPDGGHDLHQRILRLLQRGVRPVRTALHVQQLCAPGFAACFAGTTYFLSVTFDVDYDSMPAAARTSLVDALRGQFCGRMANVGIVCEEASLALELTAGPAGSGRRARRTGTTNATVEMPRGTTRTQAIAIAADIEAEPITAGYVMVGNGGATTTSTAASVTSESTSPDLTTNTSGSADSEKGIDSLLLVLIISVVVLVVGLTALVLRHRHQHTPGLGDLPKGGLGGTPIAFDKTSGMTPAQQIARAQLQQARLEGAATTNDQQPPSQQQPQPPIQDENYAVLASKSKRKRDAQAAPPLETLSTYAALGPQAHEATATAAAAAATATPEQQTYALLASQSKRNMKPGATAASGGAYAQLSPGSAAPVAGNLYAHTPAHGPARLLSDPVYEPARLGSETYETIDVKLSPGSAAPIAGNPAGTHAPAHGPERLLSEAVYEPAHLGSETYETIDDVDPTYDVDPQFHAVAQPLVNDDYEAPAALEPTAVFSFFGTGRNNNAKAAGGGDPTYEFDQQPDAVAQPPGKGGYEVPAALGTDLDNAEAAGGGDPTYEFDQQPDAVAQPPGNGGYEVPAALRTELGTGPDNAKVAGVV